MTTRIFAAIAFDTHAESASATCNTTGTLSYTVTGANPVLLVAVFKSSNVETNTVTFGAQSMTFVASTTQSAGTVSLWRLAAPTTGSSQTITATEAGSDTCALAAMSFTGVDQTTPIDSFTKNNGLSTAVTATTTTVADNAWTVDASIEVAKRSLTAGASQTKMASSTVGNDGFATSYKGPDTPAGSFSNNYQFAPSATVNWAEVLVSLTPAGAAVAPKMRVIVYSGKVIIQGRVVIQ